MKKAFLVKASVMTRVVVDVPNNFITNIYNDSYPNETEVKILTEALPRLKDNICVENIEEIIEDTECPYDANYDKKLPDLFYGDDDGRAE